MSTGKKIAAQNAHFEQVFEQLTDAQAQAVSAIEGPVLVIAGPGTGKTHILSARIGKILLETDALPHNILCLTFTDAGVQAMRERLMQFIGAEAHRVHIFTFHSFCNRIIQDNLELFGRHDLEPISELERVELLQEMLEELSNDHPLRQGRASDIHFFVPHLQDLFQRMKAENWDVDFIENNIDKYLTDLPLRKEYIYQRNGKGYKKGELKTHKIDEEKERMKRLRAATQLYPTFIDKMRAKRRYDYDDMILWVLRMFEKEENLLLNYQEQYLYFLVDEYQDTNGAQNEILHHLIHYWDNPNVFIVGDDDQSIYEFQGARLKNLTDFYEGFQPHLELVVLKDNFRSTQPILDASKILVQRNEKRIVNYLESLGVDKDLTARNKKIKRQKALPEITEYPNILHEEVALVEEIERLRTEGFPLDDVAIIYPKHRQSANLVALLQRKNIPYNIRRKVNALDVPLVQQIRNILEYLQAEYEQPYSGEHLLWQILHYDFLRISLDDLAKLSVLQAKKDWTDRAYWRDLIGDEKTFQYLKLKQPEQLIYFHKLLHELLRELGNLPVTRLIEQLINRTGMLGQVLKTPQNAPANVLKGERAHQLQLLHTFLTFVKAEVEREPRLNVERLLNLLHNMDKNRIEMAVQQTTITEPGVNLVTAHSSKGLEFRQVFLFDVVKDQWEPNTRNSRYRFPFPDTITLSGEEDALEARRRLFYVAMTRAKERLHISYSRQDLKGKERSRAVFIDELIDGGKVEVKTMQMESGSLQEAQFLLLLEKQENYLQITDNQIIKHLLEGFQLSVSALNQYLRCPVAFYYENVLRVPAVMSEAAAYGTAMHNALQRLFERMARHPEKQFSKLADLLILYKYELDKQRGYFNQKSFSIAMTRGRDHLAGYYNTHINTWHKNVEMEQSISTVVNGVPIKGVIDRTEFHEKKRVHIVDYKTGKPNDARVRPPSKKEGSSNEHGGNYWRQLVFYKLLFENYQNTDKQVKTGEISYLEPNQRGEYLTKKVTFKQDDVEYVRQLIQTTYRKIMAHEFSEGCGEERCEWCTFLRQVGGSAPASFSDLEVELLDDK